MKNQSFQDFIEKNTQGSSSPTKEHFLRIEQKIAQRKRKQAFTQGAALLSICALAFYFISSPMTSKSSLPLDLTDSDLSFLEETFALENEEEGLSDDDLYIYSELITL